MLSSTRINVLASLEYSTAKIMKKVPTKSIYNPQPTLDCVNETSLSMNQEAIKIVKEKIIKEIAAKSLVGTIEMRIN